MQMVSLSELQSWEQIRELVCNRFGKDEEVGILNLAYIFSNRLDYC